MKDSGRGLFVSIVLDRGRNFVRLLQDDLRAFELEEVAALQMVVDRRASHATRQEVDDALQAVVRARANQEQVSQLLADEGADLCEAEALRPAA